MKTMLERLRREWLALSAKARRGLSIVMVLAIVLALPALLYWFSAEHERLARRIAEADARFESLQATVSEIERLHREAVAAPEPAGEETVRAAFRSAGLAMAVKREGVDRLRVQGTVDFDHAVTVLAALHRDYHLRLVTLAASRDGVGVRIDALLGRSDS
jgi:type II secretory pathway component PulM